MPVLAPEKIDENGLLATYTAADAGGDTFVNDGRTVLHMKNTDASPTTVTVTAETATTEKPGYGTLTKANAVTVMAATTEEFLGPFPAIAFGAVGAVTYSSVTALTVAVLKI